MFFLCLFVLNKFPIRIQGQPIRYQNYITYLGITFTDKLKMTKHINNILSKLTLPINTIKFLSYKYNKCDKNILFTLYKTLIRPIITHATPTLLTLTNTQTNILKRTERRVFRYCLKLPPWTSNQNTYNLANIDNIQSHIQKLSVKYLERAHNREHYSHLFENTIPNTTVHTLTHLHI